MVWFDESRLDDASALAAADLRRATLAGSPAFIGGAQQCIEVQPLEQLDAKRLALHPHDPADQRQRGLADLDIGSRPGRERRQQHHSVRRDVADGHVAPSPLAAHLGGNDDFPPRFSRLHLMIPRRGYPDGRHRAGGVTQYRAYRHLAGRG